MVSKKLQPERNKKDGLRAIKNPTKFKRISSLKSPLYYLKTTTNFIKNFVTSIRNNVNVSALYNLCVYNSGMVFDFLSACNKNEENFLTVCENKEIEGILNKLKTYCRSIDNKSVIPNFFVQTELKKSARYYAIQIWNWKRACRVNTYKNTLCHVKMYIAKAFNAMTSKDIEVIQRLLQEEDYVWTDIFVLLDNIANNQYLPILFSLLHRWFMTMPLLEEFNKYIPWETLMDIRTYLLNPDELYSTLLTVIYNQD